MYKLYTDEFKTIHICVTDSLIHAEFESSVLILVIVALQKKCLGKSPLNIYFPDLSTTSHGIHQ